jgi:hypothetical protein
MDKLEHYLAQVCRTLGGPSAMRQHVRQELREHLLDAVAQHRAAGMSDEAALDRALEEFGKPEDVRSELEATHRQRMIAVLIDKAMQWKERTMRAKWLWVSWAYVTLAVVIALEVLLIWFNMLYIIPKFQKLLHDGMIDAAELEEQGALGAANFLHNLSYLSGRYTTWLLLLVIVAIGLFEWRVKSENKTFMRLSALGTAAAGLMVVIVIMVGSLVIPFVLAMPAMGKMARPWAEEQVATINTSITALERAQGKKDWLAMQEQAYRVANALTRLSAGPAVTSLTAGNEQNKVDELRAQVREARQALAAVQQAIRNRIGAGWTRPCRSFARRTVR